MYAINIIGSLKTNIIGHYQYTGNPFDTLPARIPSFFPYHSLASEYSSLRACHFFIGLFDLLGFHMYVSTFLSATVFLKNTHYYCRCFQTLYHIGDLESIHSNCIK